MIKNNPLLKDFEEVALKFSKNGKPSVSGLYILQNFNDDYIFIRLKSFVNNESDCKLPSPKSTDEKGWLLRNYRGIEGEMRIVMHFLTV